MPPRPARPLSTLGLLRTASTNSLAICDEELFDELFVARRYVVQPVFFVSDPAAIKRVLLDNFDNYPRMAPIRRLFEAELRTGTLGSEGETWSRHRRVATPTIDPRAIRPDIPALIALAERTADELEAGPVEIDMERWVSRISLVLWNHVVTGGDPDALPMLHWLSKIPRKPRLADLVPKVRWVDKLLVRGRQDETTARLDAELHAMVDARRESGYSGPHDLIWRLAHGRDRESGDLLPRDEVRDEAASLIAGGAASVRALTWVWYLLAIHPGAERTLHAELDAVLGDHQPRPAQLTALPYARQVLEETMRLYPPIPGIIREAAGVDTLCGHRVPRRAIVAILPWVVHRHRKLWAEPDRFDPGRFDPASSLTRPRFSYLPFAAGPRVCVGASFAMTQLLVVVSVLARRFRFRLVSDAPVVPVGRISLQPKGGLPMRVERR